MPWENPPSTPPGPPSVDGEREALVQRIVSSATFARAPQLRGFLLFVSERLLAGRAGEINEYEIGREVLGRRASFNPHEDNIVRVQARHLRAKLEQYFEAEGKEEPLVVTIPRGSYVPSFEPRLATRENPAGIPAPPAAAPAPAPARSRAGLYCRLAVVAIASLAVGWSLHRSWRAAPAVAGATAPGNPILARVLGGDSGKVVLSDAGAVLLQEFLHRPISLADYLRSDYPRALLPQHSGFDQVLLRDSLRSRTSYGDLAAAGRLLDLARKYQARLVFRHPRHLNIRDFETGNFILLGGPLADPWYRLFEDSLNFVFESDLHTGRAWIRNKHAQRGEPGIYAPAGGAPTEYALASLVPNLRGAGNVLLLAGTTAEGAEAASDLVLREDLPADLRRIALQCRGPADSFEALIETHVIAGMARDSKLIAWRIHGGL